MGGLEIELEEPELNLLLKEEPQSDWRRWRAAAIGSAVFHLVLTASLWNVNLAETTQRPPEEIFVKHVTPLYVPPELTQKAPNKSPVSKEISVESIAPRPVLKAPAPAPTSGKPLEARTAPLPMPPPPPPRQVPVQAPVLMEAPKLEGPVQNVQTAQAAKTVALPPPPSAEAPKLALQDVGQRPTGAGRGQATGLVQVPTASVQDALKTMSKTGGLPGVQSVGDLGADMGGSGPGLNLPPSAGRPRTDIQLLSDPMGVDFRPYMVQVVAAIRRNWFAVYPEAARLGQRGQVTLQFTVLKKGLVQKIVFSMQSGAKALDQSAVAAMSASNPLPPLPAEFKGDSISLQMNFLYNMQR